MPASPTSSTAWPSPPCASAQRSSSSAELLFAPDHRRQIGPLAGIEAGVGRPLAEHRVRRHRLGDALELVAAQRLQGKARGQQLPREVVDHHLRRRGQAQDARGKVRHQPHGRLLVRRAFARQPAHHDGAGADAHARGQALVGAEAMDQRQARTHGALGVVLVGARPAEVGQHAVAEEVGDVAVELGHHARAGLVEGLDQLTHLLGMQVRGSAVSAGPWRSRAP